MFNLFFYLAFILFIVFNFNTLRKLLIKTVNQAKAQTPNLILIMILLFLFSVGFATACIYYAGNWIISYVEPGFIQEIVKIIIILIVIGLTSYTLQTQLKKMASNNKK